MKARGDASPMEGMNHPHQVRNQQPQQTPQTDSVVHQPSPGTRQNQSSSKWYHPTMESKIALVLITIASLLVVFALAASAFSNGSSTSTMNLVQEDQYQAVFLSNGQVYFGKITAASSKTLVLEDIFYLQVDQQLQPEQETAQANPQVSLAKLGNELHGPEDQMFISMNEVVFWENLRDDGDVVQAIMQFNQNGNAEAPIEGAPEAGAGVEEAEQATEEEELTEE